MGPGRFPIGAAGCTARTATARSLGAAGLVAPRSQAPVHCATGRFPDEAHVHSAARATQGTRWPGSAPERLAHRKPGAHRRLRGCHQRSSVDPRRSRARRGRVALGQHDRARLSDALALPDDARPRRPSARSTPVSARSSTTGSRSCGFRTRSRSTAGSACAASSTRSKRSRAGCRPPSGRHSRSTAKRSPRASPRPSCGSTSDVLDSCRIDIGSPPTPRYSRATDTNTSRQEENPT